MVTVFLNDIAGCPLPCNPSLSQAFVSGVKSLFSYDQQPALEVGATGSSERVRNSEIHCFAPVFLGIRGPDHFGHIRVPFQ